MSDMNVQVPDIGDASEVEVIEVAVKVGDVVEEGDTLIVLESDKASMEIPAPASGTIVSLSVKEGDQVNEGTAIAVMSGGEAVAEPAQRPPANLLANPLPSLRRARLSRHRPRRPLPRRFGCLTLASPPRSKSLKCRLKSAMSLKKAIP